MRRRYVDYVHHVEFEFPYGNVPSESVHTSGEVGIVVGSLSGTLAVYCGRSSKPVSTVHDLGSLTCVTSGDVFHTGSPAILALAAEGKGYVFDPSLSPMAAFHLPTNSSCAIIADVDADGRAEIVIAAADRSLTVYRLQRLDDTSPDVQDWELVDLVSWALPSQIRSLSTIALPSGVGIVASQPGGEGLVFRACHWGGDPPLATGGGSADAQVVGLDDGRLGVATTDGVVRMLELHQHGEEEEEGEGEEGGETTIGWEVQLSRRLLSATSLDVCQEGGRGVMTLCAWDGVTYFMDPSGNVVRFDADERVSAFAAGYYRIDPEGDPSLVLVYVTYSDKIKVFYDVGLNSIGRETIGPDVGLRLLESAYSDLLAQ